MMRGAWLVVVTSACSFTPGALPPDGRGVDATADVPDPTFGWSTPVELAELHSADGNDDPSLTNDLLEIYFGSRRPGGLGVEDIWMAKRTAIDQPFGAPVNVTALNSVASETTMKITGEGKAIFFASDRGATGHDIYVATRVDRDSPWTTPVLVAELSTVNGDWGAFAQSDLLRVILCSGVNVAAEALYVAKRASTASPWGSLAKITELDEAGFSECDPDEPNPRTLYYASDFLGGSGGTFDIYRASRLTTADPYGGRTGLSINLTGFNDRDPWVSPDERTLVFSSDRDGVNFQLYLTTRQ